MKKCILSLIVLFGIGSAIDAATTTLTPAQLQENLYKAIDNNNATWIKQVIGNGAQPNKLDKNGETALDYARRIKAKKSTLNALTDSGAQLGPKTLRENLYKAINTNNAKWIKEVIANGAQVNEINTIGGTPLHYAISKGAKPSTIQALVDNGANVNIRHTSEKLYNGTPLHFAVTYSVNLGTDNAVEIIKILRNKGASRVMPNSNYDSPVQVAKDNFYDPAKAKQKDHWRRIVEALGEGVEKEPAPKPTRERKRWGDIPLGLPKTKGEAIEFGKQVGEAL